MFIKLCNLGRDAEVRYTPSGHPVANLSLAYSIPHGDKNKRTQWIDASLWGDRAEKLAPYLKKGRQLVIYADDLQLETYKKSNGEFGAKIKCRVVDIDFAGSGERSVAAPANERPESSAPAGLDNFDDDIPF